MHHSSDTRRFARFAHLGCLLILLAGGCSKEDRGTVPVSGKVTYQGQPIEGAVVTFASTGTGTPGAGLTTADGTYKLDVKPGSYAAIVTKFEVPTATQEPVGDVPPKQLLPAKYGNPTESPLRFDVKKGDANTFDLLLAD